MALIDLANPTRFVALVERVLPWLIGATVIAFAIGLRGIGLASPRPRRIDPSLEVLNADVVYGAAENFIAFDAADLTRKVVRSAADLEGMVDYIAYDPLFCFRSATPIAGQIRSMLLERAGRGEPVPDSLLAADALTAGHQPVAEVPERGHHERQQQHDRRQRVEGRSAVAAVLRRVDDH